MKNVMKIGTALVAAAMLLAGCGDSMMPLTEDEESTVVNYSAGILAKHNSFQQEGMTAVYPEEEDEPEEEEESEEREKPDDADDSDDADEKKKPDDAEKADGSDDAEKPDGEEKTDKDKSPDKEEAAKGEAADEEAGPLTLTKALSVPKVEFSYHDYSTASNYKQGESFSLDASAGNVYVMLNINMTNTGSQAAECDVLSKQPTFTLSLNGEAGVLNEMTMLTNDLSTYKGVLDPGQTEATILLFEVPQKTAENISTIQLSAQINGKTSEIILK